jgi:hypothetical protein
MDPAADEALAMRVLGPPASEAIGLEHRPQVLSWDAAGTPMQQRLIPYREEIQRKFADSVRRAGTAFDLTCGLGPGSNLEQLGDIDNFLGPVAHALGPSTILSAWGAKTSNVVSFLAVGEPTAMELRPVDGWNIRSVQTTVAAGGNSWKEQIAQQIADLEPSPTTTPIELVLHFRTGPTRNWMNLWKPAIDSLHSILGVGPRLWHPRDGLIYRLGLSSETDPALEWKVDIDIAWRATAA